MARRNPVRDKLVAQARQTQKRANDKAYRLRNGGVNLTGLDPRQKFNQVRDMNARQLRSYIKRLDNFVSRKNGFVAGLRGKPISRESFQEYKRLERQYNKASKAYEEQFGGITVPGLGVSVEQALKDQRDRPGGERRAFQQYNRDARNITDQESMNDLLKQMRAKTDPKYLEKTVREYRKRLKEMTDETGDNVVQQRLSEMSDNQLAFLVDYTGFMNALGGRYDYQKALNVNEQYEPENWMNDRFRDNAGVILEAIKSVREQIPSEGQRDAAPKSKRGVTNRDKSEYTDTRARLIPTQKRAEFTDTNARPVPVQKPKRKR